jgi:hypothetical protein
MRRLCASFTAICASNKAAVHRNLSNLFCFLQLLVQISRRPRANLALKPKQKGSAKFDFHGAAFFGNPLPAAHNIDTGTACSFSSNEGQIPINPQNLPAQQAAARLALLAGAARMTCSPNKSRSG